ncbi:MAG TPA: hypothetical protein VG222_15480 [Vicinamibacterales bacterium]|nr:hypothetical protein [Vicinamibacterales bacterium]
MSEFRVAKGKADAVLTLADGSTVRGRFFIAGSSAIGSGPERVKDLLASETGFFPFEVSEAGAVRTLLYNRAHVIMVELTGDDEPRRSPDYDIAPRRSVSLLLSNGARVPGTVRVYRPRGRDRLSDFARSNETFRYIEIPGATLIVNVAHIIELSEMTES